MNASRHSNLKLSFLAHHPHARSAFAIGFLLLGTLLLGGCGTQLPPPPVAQAASAQPSVTHTTTQGYTIQVFFSKAPTSLSTDPTAVYPVERISPTQAVATYAIQELIAGPTLSEHSAGYFTELNTLLSGSSNCSAPLPIGGPDFTLTLNMKGSQPETGTATLKFCRDLLSPGIGADARVTAEIEATLKQFSNIKNVVILNKNGHCFADNLGNDGCLH